VLSIEKGFMGLDERIKIKQLIKENPQFIAELRVFLSGP